MEQDDILDKINSAKEEFYSSNNKNNIFKKKQKFNCANSIMSTVNESDVFANVFIVKDDTILFNYPVFKLIASPELYLKMAEHILEITEQIVIVYGKYNMHFNCSGVTVSAIERYKDFVSIVSKKGLDNGKNLLNKLDKVHIHNSPSFIDYGLKVFIPMVDNNIWNKLVIVSKDSKDSKNA
jgi:hypothetical protein